MINGGATKFSKVPSIPDNGVITKNYLRGIENAVAQRTPIAGTGIKIQVSDGSYTILSDLIGLNLKVINVDVCVDGRPKTMSFYGPAS